MSDLENGGSRTASPMFIALACVGFIASAPVLAQAAPAPAEEEEGAELQGMTVVDTAIDDEIKVDRVESPKATADLLDTPQTITVISSQVLRKQNLLTLRDALATVPGITFGAGEGGGGYGDSINLRGYSANTDITQDGVRDSAQYSRTDPFNLQQIEVYNGANSVFNGSGSVGGTINLVSKAPQASDLTIVQGSVGTDNYYRAAVDTNRRVSELIAVRLNAMVHRNDVPGRDVETYKRWGVAPSITIGIDSPTSLTLAYVHQKDDNVPIYGVPYFNNAFNNGPLALADDSDYFGYRNLDAQETTVDRLTMTATHAFSDAVSIRNLTRWQRVGQYSQTSAPQGTFCIGATTATGTPCGTLPVGFYQPSGPRGLVRDQENQLLYNQTDLRVLTEREGLKNVLNIGSSLSTEDYQIKTAQLLRNPGGALPNPVLPIDAIADPVSTWTGPINYVLTALSKSTTRNAAIYAFDTLSIGEMFELNGGVRYEWNKARFNAVPLATYPPGTVPLTALQLATQGNYEQLFSYRVGAVFKPTPATSLYAAYGNARTPSSATVRLGCGPISAPGAADPCASAPETARNYEIGAKADLFDRRFQLTAALFRNERSNYRVVSNDPAQPAALQVLDGRSRVDGIALGASGNISDAWAIFANYTYLDSKVRRSVSDFCLANPGSTGCANSVAIPDPQRGTAIVQTPKHSGSLFTTYTLPFGLQLGYGLTYQGSFAINAPTLVAPVQYRAEEYLTHRLFASYELAEGITAQINVQNVTNEDYYTGIRDNGWAIPAEARSAVLSVFYSF
ncbi:MAG: iron complex outerrane receptor protein [Sphingomonas bacterium]|nr:iron complex outerrane receptor protein [Sphingomonas bacterium]